VAALTELKEAGVASGVIIPGCPGGAVQVRPIKPVLKAPGTKRLMLTCDELLSSFAFKCSLRRYTPAWTRRATCCWRWSAR